jgi:RNA polymerase-binding transcription factor DksA
VTDIPATIAPAPEPTTPTEVGDSTDPAGATETSDETTEGSVTDTSELLGAETSEEPGDVLDLDAVDADFVAVERALARLADGTYWTDEVTGEPIPDDVLMSDPTARRASHG